MESLLAAQRLVLVMLLAWWAGRVAVVRHAHGAPSEPRPLRLFSLGILALFALTWLWQGFWTFSAQQVTAFRKVEQFDPRAWRLASPADRREVTDRHGRPLVANRRVDGTLRRVYPLGPAAAHVTGYFHRRYGRAGIEAACEDILATWRQPAWRTLENAARLGPEALPEPLKLTIDARLQRLAARALAGRRGAVVVLNPAGGDLLALVSQPAFDPNTIGRATFPRLAADPLSPLLNRAIHGLYPPGSTFKPVVAATALSLGYPADTRFAAGPEGYLPPYDTRRIKDYEAADYAARGRRWRGHGELTMADALACSANGYFAWLGVQLGAPPLLAQAERLGLATAWDLARTPLGLGALRAMPGRLPQGNLKPGATARCAIGQHHILVTPLGLAVAASAIANYGYLVAPRLRLSTPPAGPRPVLEPAVARQLQSMMERVVSAPHGTAHGLRLAGLPVAAKTGSAENAHGRAHAWVMAFAPSRRASLAVAVLVENGGTGSEAAVPIARELLQAAQQSGYFGTAP